MYSRVRGGTPAVPSITTVLDVLDQDMEWWEARCAVKESVKYAHRLQQIRDRAREVKNWDELSAAEDWMEKAAERDRDESSKRGDLVHNYAEVLGLTEMGLATPADLGEQERLCRDADLMPFVVQVNAFWRDWQPEPVLMEATVWNQTYRYAGTTDMIFRIVIDGVAYYVVLDWKTKKALFKKRKFGAPRDAPLVPKTDLRLYTSMQLAAAAHGEELWVPGAEEDGSQDRWVPFEYDVTMGMGVAIGPDGYAARQYDITRPVVWDTFASLRTAWEFRRLDAADLMTERLTGPQSLRPPGTPVHDATVSRDAATQDALSVA